MDFATHKQSVTFVANDTDVLVLLVYHFHENSDNLSDIIMQFVAEQHKINWKLLIPIHQVCVRISPITAKLLLTIRAISGCDCTSSSLFGHGKKNIFKTLTNIPDIVQFAEVIALSRHT